MKPRVEFIVGHNYTIEILTNLKLIASYKHRYGYLVARYGVNKTTLKKMSKRLNGEK